MSHSEKKAFRTILHVSYVCIKRVLQIVCVRKVWSAFFIVWLILTESQSPCMQILGELFSKWDVNVVTISCLLLLSGCFGEEVL